MLHVCTGLAEVQEDLLIFLSTTPVLAVAVGQLTQTGAGEATLTNAVAAALSPLVQTNGNGPASLPVSNTS